MSTFDKQVLLDDKHTSKHAILNMAQIVSKAARNKLVLRRANVWQLPVPLAAAWVYADSR